MLESVIRGLPLSISGGKTLLIPPSSNAALIKRAIALRAGNVANFSVLPFRRYIIEQSLNQFPGRHYISGERQFWLMFSLLHSLTPSLRFFTDPALYHGLVELVIATLSELRLNGVRSSDLTALPVKEKWSDMRLIREQYDIVKKEQGLYDYPDAVDALLAHPVTVPDCSLVKHPLGSAELDLVTSMKIQVVEPVSTSDPLLSGYRVDTPYQEVLQTIRNIVDDFRSLPSGTRVGICTSAYAETAAMIAPVLSAEKLEGLIEFADGIPMITAAPAVLWLTCVEWVRHDFSIGRFLRILETEGFDREGAEAGTFHRALRFIRDSDLALFDRNFQAAFKEYAHGLRVTDEDLDPTAEDAVTLALRLVKRFNRVISHDDPLRRLEALTDVFLESVRIASDTDAEAVAHIESVLGVIAEMEPRGLAFDDLLGIISSRLSGRRINNTVPGFSKAILGTPDDLQWCECDKLYVLGMNELGMPGKTFQNPLLLDSEKQTLRKELPDARFQLLDDLLREDRRKFDLLAGSVKKELVLSAPVRDLHSGREMLVSTYLLTEFNRRHDTRDDFRAISKRLQEDPRSQNNYVTPAPEHAFFMFDLAVAAALNVGQPARALFATSFPFAAAIASFREDRRTAPVFDRTWGVVHPGSAYELPVLSASKLVTWSRCPYQYFLRYVLFLERTEEYDRSELRWLDPLAYGTFLHTLYYRFLLRLRERKGNWYTSVDRSDKAIMIEEFERILQEYRIAFPVNSQVHYEHQSEQLRRDAELFVDHEQSNTNSRVFVELSFNMPANVSREPLVQKADPARIQLPDGKEISVRGAIDRVDQNPDGRAILTDYKTGNAHWARVYEAEGTRVFGGGELIQAGLYSEIVGQADASLSDPLFRFYYATEHSGFYEYVVDYPEHRDHFLALLGGICSEIKRGNFAPAGQDINAPPCNYCDYAPVCIDGRQQVARRLRFSDPNAERHEKLRNEDIP